MEASPLLSTVAVPETANSVPSSLLSPLVSPFQPDGSMMGRSKARWWAAEDLDTFNAEVSPAISSTPYLDAVRRGP